MTGGQVSNFLEDGVTILGRKSQVSWRKVSQFLEDGITIFGEDGNLNFLEECVGCLKFLGGRCNNFREEEYLKFQ
ncbi:hypothetical protein J6590_053953, partial [Homalodisca vitripennis]